VDNAQKIKENIDIVAHIGKTIELKKTGKNFRGVCPFHREKTPSFFVSPDRQTWHCFGCSKGGDIITYTMEKEGLDFLGTLEILSQTYNIPLEARTSTEAGPDERIYQTLKDASSYFRTQLLLPENTHAFEYISKTRGVSDELITRFSIGYAPNSWDQTGRFLQNEGHSESLLTEAGLAIKKEGGTGWYDRFRDRIVFPIEDRMGRVVGFIARSLNKEETAKYLNSPETSVFKKSKLLYGLSQAKDKILLQDYAIVVEGTLDVISFHLHGIENVVAPLGTALTQDHISMLRRLSKRVIFLFDSDKAGIDATFRSIPLALQAGMEVKVAQLSEGKDPDEAFRADATKTKQDISQAQDAISFAITYAQSSFDSHSPHFQKQAADIVLPLIRSIENSIDQEAALRKLSNVLHISLETLNKELYKTSGITPINLISEHTTKTTNQNSISKSKQLWETLVASLLQLPDSLQEDATFIEIIKPLKVSSTTHPLLSIAQKLLSELKQRGKIEVSSFIRDLTEIERTTADLLLLKDLGTIVDNNETYKDAVMHIVLSIRRYQTRSRIAQISAIAAPSEEEMIELKTITQALKNLQ